jgi:hypothetical protein
MTRYLPLIFLLAFAPASPAGQAPTFFRAVNLGGPALTIDDRRWDGNEAPYLACKDQQFENQKVSLHPATDPARARMIRSSRWAPDGRNHVALRDLPRGTYTVYVYLWEDNDPQKFTLSLEGKAVAHVNSGKGGTWQKLGPWTVAVKDGTLDLTSRGGHANLSGVEVWKGAGRPPAVAKKPKLDEAGRWFDAKVAPLLARRCLGCHNPTLAKGKLDLSSREGFHKGGRRGPVVVAGKLADNRLWQRIDDEEMPPREPLSAPEKAILKEWLAGGARWGTSPIDPYLFSSDKHGGYDWWSLQPVRRPPLPTVKAKGWVRNDLDTFVLARLEATGLSPSPEADRRTLIRRLKFDLLGLPPSPGEVDAFLADRSPEAYERLVDRYLDSPHYGERWARHWLDLVRFGESQGFERNRFWPDVWRYRDWVIEAFNADLPYDEFVRLQIAGDVLRPDDPLAVVATGQLVVGPYDLTIQAEGTAAMRAAAREEELEGIVATVAQTYLGLTVNCARCHDHKFDPIARKDYYRFAAALGGVRFGEKESLSKGGKARARKEIAELGKQIAELRKREARAKGPLVKRNLAQQARRLEARRRLLAGGQAHVVTPRQPELFHVLDRGDYRLKGEVVTPGGLRAVRTLSPDLGLAADAPEGARRIALAKWITDPANPLTSRVIVNRLWQYHIGRGLVATPNDFGFNGGRPSHPQLLDYLADELVKRKWSLNAIHRLIVTSAAYRQASLPRPDGEKKDPENHLLWRASPRRLEAEALRDAVLTVSGRLDRTMGGPGYQDFKIKKGLNTVYEPITRPDPKFCRRTIYRTWVRATTDPLLVSFDCPDPSVATPRRTVTTTPLQALSLLNNAFMTDAARHFARRVAGEAGKEPARQVERAYLLAFGRTPDEREARRATAFVHEFGLDQFCLALFNANEFLFID